MDQSTLGLQARSMLASTSADVHRTAYNKAYDDALKYVTGLTADEIPVRKEKIAEATDPYTAALNAYLGIYGHGGSSSETLRTALGGAGDMTKAAALGGQAAGVGAAATKAEDDLTGTWGSLKSIFGGNDDIWGNPVATNSDNSWLPGGTQMYGGIVTQ